MEPQPRDNPAVLAIIELIFLLDSTADAGGLLLIARAALDHVELDRSWWRAHLVALAGLDLAGSALDDVLAEWLASHSDEPPIPDQLVKQSPAEALL